MSENTKVNLTIDDYTLDKIKSIAIKDYRTLSAQVNFILQQWLKQYEKDMYKPL